MFGDRVRRVRGHTSDQHAEPLGRREIDVIEARRAQRDHARAARVKLFERGRVDQVVDERADHVVTVREDRGFAVEMGFLKVQFVAVRGIGFGEGLAVVLAAAEQDHAHIGLPERHRLKHVSEVSCELGFQQ